jgi:hypothetical protein
VYCSLFLRSQQINNLRYREQGKLQNILEVKVICFECVLQNLFRTAIVVELPLPRALFEMLPMPLQWGGLIAVVPVLLTQAVIPQQLTDLTSVGRCVFSDCFIVVMKYFRFVCCWQTK